jgi:MoaA/NifB/PqqE/SkfB family radical SAM enzyme
MERGPLWIYAANDLSCNLACPQCRPHPIITKNVNLDLLDRYLPTAELVSVLNSGDPFASPRYLELLQSIDPEEYPKLRIELFTNGLLLPRFWPSLFKIHDRITRLRVSIDAATEATYRKLRGGNWKLLLESLRFIKTLSVPYVAYNFCAQEENIDEAPDFVDFAIDNGATEAVFNVLRPYSHIQPDSVNRPATKEAIQQVLADPRMGQPNVHCPMLRAASQ